MSGLPDLYDDDVDLPPKSELDQLRLDNERLRKQAKCYKGQMESLERTRPLCPDHRDKQSGKYCLVCRLEVSERHLADKTRECELLSDQNNALELSSKHCASCGLLLPNHADECGRYPVVVEELQRQLDDKTAAFSAMSSLQDETMKLLSDLRLRHDEQLKVIGRCIFRDTEESQKTETSEGVESNALLNTAAYGWARHIVKLLIETRARLEQARECLREAIEQAERINNTYDPFVEILDSTIAKWRAAAQG